MYIRKTLGFFQEKVPLFIETFTHTRTHQFSYISLSSIVFPPADLDKHKTPGSTIYRYLSFIFLIMGSNWVREIRRQYEEKIEQRSIPLGDSFFISFRYHHCRSTLSLYGPFFCLFNADFSQHINRYKKLRVNLVTDWPSDLARLSESHKVWLDHSSSYTEICQKVSLNRNELIEWWNVWLGYLIPAVSFRIKAHVGGGYWTDGRRRQERRRHYYWHWNPHCFLLFRIHTHAHKCNQKANHTFYFTPRPIYH